MNTQLVETLVNIIDNLTPEEKLFFQQKTKGILATEAKNRPFYETATPQIFYWLKVKMFV